MIAPPAQQADSAGLRVLRQSSRLGTPSARRSPDAELYALCVVAAGVGAPRAPACPCRVERPGNVGEGPIRSGEWVAGRPSRRAATCRRCDEPFAFAAQAKADLRDPTVCDVAARCRMIDENTGGVEPWTVERDGVPPGPRPRRDRPRPAGRRGRPVGADRRSRGWLPSAPPPSPATARPSCWRVATARARPRWHPGWCRRAGSIWPMPSPSSSSRARLTSSRTGDRSHSRGRRGRRGAAVVTRVVPASAVGRSPGDVARGNRHRQTVRRCGPDRAHRTGRGDRSVDSHLALDAGWACRFPPACLRSLEHSLVDDVVHGRELDRRLRRHHGAAS